MTRLHIHLHAACPAIDVHDLRSLSAEEYARAAQFARDSDRLQFLLSRVFLRGHIAHELGCLPVQIRFARGAHGKPRIEAPSSGELGFSLSHTAGVIAIAVGRGALGVDIEHVGKRVFPAEIETRVFSERERDLLRASSPESRSHLAFAWWTRKEAVLKADGRGLGFGPALTELDVSGQDATADASWSCMADGISWWGETHTVALSFACSIAREANNDPANTAIKWNIPHE